MTDNGQWVHPGRAAEIYGVSLQTLRNWAERGRIAHKETPGGQRRYLAGGSAAEDAGEKADNRYGIIYARVSARKQKSDLQRQIDHLRARFPGYRVISDIASGVNFERKGLRTVLDACMRGLVSEVVVSYRDRLARIGVGLVEYIIAQSGSVLTVTESRERERGDDHTELAEDVLAVLTHFTAKHHGRRSYRRGPDSAEAGCGSARGVSPHGGGDEIHVQPSEGDM